MMISPGADDGIPGETRELYPAFLQAAREEKKSEAGKIFSYAALVEEVHAEVFARALEAARAGHDLAAADVYLCLVCSVFGKKYLRIVP
ncbi:MAG: hypothetical protein ABSG28_07630 [Methanoregula sp.]|jgi:rubrerythrin|uniref:hypothetical protein n=1 Tax=Methanoregula sp. TaxID=2052170 RepID=UPI003C26A1F8